MEAVAVVRPERCGESELDVPGVREHAHDVGQGQVQLLLADGGVGGPGDVTAEAARVNRLGSSEIRISDEKNATFSTKVNIGTAHLRCVFSQPPTSKASQLKVTLSALRYFCVSDIFCRQVEFGSSSWL